MNDNTEIRNPMKDVRLALGITQGEMAKRLQSSAMTVRRCEYERRLPGTVAVLANLRKMAKQAGVTIEDATQKAVTP
jgi:DNA-binding XRE family transcriptional regulator